MLDLGRANAVSKRAEGAVGRGVAVTTNEHRARQREALLRSDDVADALPPVELVVVFEAEQLGVLGEIGDLRRALGIRVGLGAVRGRHVVVDDQQRLFGRSYREAGAPQACECLRAVHLVHDVPVDIEQARAIWLLVHQVLVPDHVVESVAHCACLLRSACASRASVMPSRLMVRSGQMPIRAQNQSFLKKKWKPPQSGSARTPGMVLSTRRF